MMGRAEAEAQLIEYATLTADRDNLIGQALKAGVPIARIADLSGIARSTVYRIVARREVRY